MTDVVTDLKSVGKIVDFLGIASISFVCSVDTNKMSILDKGSPTINQALYTPTHLTTTSTNAARVAAPPQTKITAIMIVTQG